ncbi:MAG: hemolysin family protein [bacterium]
MILGLGTVTWLQIMALVMLLILSGFFSGSETALTSLGKLRSKRIMTDLEGSQHRRFKQGLQYWLDNSQDVLISILVGNNLVNIFASALATVVATKVFREFFNLSNSLAWGSGVATGVMTLLVLVFGEITPKSYAKDNPEFFARLILPPIIAFTQAIYPVIVFMRGLTKVIVHIFGGELPSRQTSITEEELKSLVLAGREEGTLEESELQMLHSVFEFDETVVREIMVPRTDIRALDVRTSLEKTIEFARETGFSRIPVYDEKIDQIEGILNIKDLIIREKNQDDDDFNLLDIVRTAYFVPEAKKVNQLLTEFRRNQVHMAIVVDEYGGTSGLITMEDILEQIVGEIQDEYDDERDWALKIQDDAYIVDARIDLDDLVDRIGVKLPDEEYDSLGGMLVEKTGKIPDEGDEVEYNGMRFVVVSADEKRVKKVRMLLDETPDDDETPPVDEPALEETLED